MLRCRAAMVRPASTALGISGVSVTSGFRELCVKRISTNVPVSRVGTAEVAGTSSAGTSARVLQGRSEHTASPTLTNVPRHRATTVERVMISWADTGASARRVLPGVSARRTLTNASRSRAPGPEPSAAFSATRAMDICASAWTDGPDQDAKPAHLGARAGMVDDVRNHRLPAYAHVLRYYTVSQKKQQ